MAAQNHPQFHFQGIWWHSGIYGHQTYIGIETLTQANVNTHKNISQGTTWGRQEVQTYFCFLNISAIFSFSTWNWSFTPVTSVILSKMAASDGSGAQMPHVKSEEWCCQTIYYQQVPFPSLFSPSNSASEPWHIISWVRVLCFIMVTHFPSVRVWIIFQKVYVKTISEPWTLDFDFGDRTLK